MNCAKIVVPIEMQFGMLSRVAPVLDVLDGVHIGVTWQIRLNRPCAAVMRPYGTKIAITGFVRIIATRQLVMEGV